MGSFSIYFARSTFHMVSLCASEAASYSGWYLQVWQGAALDALAAWLSEDASRVEPRLAAREACQRFVALFAAYAPSGDSETLSRLLKPFLRMLRHSKRITVRPCPPNLRLLLWYLVGMCWAQSGQGGLLTSAS